MEKQNIRKNTCQAEDPIIRELSSIAQVKQDKRVAIIITEGQPKIIGNIHIINTWMRYNIVCKHPNRIFSRKNK